MKQGYKEHKRRLSDGTYAVYRYETWTGKRLFELPGTPAFEREIAALRGAKADIAKGTLGYVLNEYIRSPAYTRLAPGSKARYASCIELLREMADVNIKEIKRADLRAIRDAAEKYRGPGAANSLVATMKVIFANAAEYDYIEHSPAAHIKRIKLGEYATWPDDLLDRFEHGCKPKAIKLGFLLGLHTGQRRSDITSLRWSQYDGTALTFKQQKTGIELTVPCTPALKAALDEAKRTTNSVFIVATATGTRFHDNAFSSAFSAEMKRLGMPSHKDGGYTFHGLRKSAAARLAECGCTVHEIMAITGHTTMTMVQHYTKRADQKRRAVDAIAKIGERK